MHRVLSLLLLAIAATASAQPTIVEAPTPAVSASGLLVQDIGIETLGGVFTPLVDRGCQVPCAITQVFSTADDRQTEIKLTLFRGEAKLSKDAERLGVYAIVGVPELPRGEPQVAVTFTVLRDKITLAAFDKRTNRPLAVARREF